MSHLKDGTEVRQIDGVASDSKQPHAVTKMFDSKTSTSSFPNSA